MLINGMLMLHMLTFIYSVGEVLAQAVSQSCSSFRDFFSFSGMK